MRVVGRESVVAGLILLVPFVLGQLSSGVSLFYYLAAQIAIMATFAMAFDLLIGFAGISSFGHAMFFGAGAYGAALTFVRTGELWLSLLMGLVAAAVLGSIVGVWVIRIFGVAILLLTFAVGQAMWLLVVINPYGITGGDSGLPGLRPPSVLGAGTELSLYVVAGGMFLVSFAALRSISVSSFGDVLRGIRENEQRLACLGFDTRAYKFVAFLISAALSGLAGAVNAFAQRQASPDAFQWLVSADVMLFALLGGRGTLVGPAVAAGAMILVRSVLSAYTNSWSLAIGAIYVLSALLVPRGLWSTLQDRARLRAGPS